MGFPAGFMDVVQLAKVNENFRLIYDVKGRFCVHRITGEEAKYKLCRVLRVSVGPNIRYPDPLVKVNDTIRVDISTNKIMDFIKFEAGNICMVTGGANTGRVGIIMNRERHQGSFDIVHVKDNNGHTFATRLGYIFVIGKGSKSYVSLPKGNGIRMTVAEERDKRLQAKA